MYILASSLVSYVTGHYISQGGVEGWSRNRGLSDVCEQVSGLLVHFSINLFLSIYTCVNIWDKWNYDKMNEVPETCIALTCVPLWVMENTFRYAEKNKCCL
jgi:hypothetical protein